MSTRRGLTMLVVALCAGASLGSMMSTTSPANAVAGSFTYTFPGSNPRLVTVDASNDGLTAYTASTDEDGNGPLYTNRVYRTTNGGYDWTALPSSPSGFWPTITTTASGSKVALAGTANGNSNGNRLYVSTNSGDSWIDRTPNANQLIHDVSFSPDGSLLAAATDIGVLYSVDNGANWTTATASPSRFLAVGVSNPDTQGVYTLVAGGDISPLVKSTNLGGSWTTIQSEVSWKDVQVSDDGSTLLVLNNTKTYLSRGGQWELVNNSLPFAGSLSPDGRTILLSTYSTGMRILRNWDQTFPVTGWVTENQVQTILATSVTNDGARYLGMKDNLSGGLYGGILVRTSVAAPRATASHLTSGCDRGESGNAVGPAAGGEHVTIRGDLLSATTRVRFGDTDATIVSTTAGSVEVVAPPGLGGPVDITVTNGDGTSILRDGYTYVGPNARGWYEMGASIDQSNPPGAARLVAMSDDGNTIAVSDPQFSSNGNTANGRVDVYSNSSGIWTRVGDPFYGDMDSANLGLGLSLNADGSRVVMGSGGLTDPSGRIYNGNTLVYERRNGAWVQFGVMTQFPIEADGTFGNVIELSGDGLTMAVGLGSAAGLAFVFEYHAPSDEWRLTGTFDSQTSDSLGNVMSLNADGTRLILGASAFSPSGLTQAGRAFLYIKQGAQWIQDGPPIVGIMDYERLGASVSMSADGSTVAVGSPSYQISGNAVGRIQTYSRVNGAWVSAVPALVGTTDNLGSSIALNSDGSRLIAASNASPGQYCPNATGIAQAYVRGASGWEKSGRELSGRPDTTYFASTMAADAAGETLIASTTDQMTSPTVFHARVFRWVTPSTPLPQNPVPQPEPSTQPSPGPSPDPSATTQPATTEPSSPAIEPVSPTELPATGPALPTANLLTPATLVSALGLTLVWVSRRRATSSGR